MNEEMNEEIPPEIMVTINTIYDALDRQAGHAVRRASLDYCTTFGASFSWGLLMQGRPVGS